MIRPAAASKTTLTTKGTRVISYILSSVNQPGKPRNPFEQRCPKARTIYKWDNVSRILSIRETTCGTYACGFCIRSRVARIRARTLEGKPTHFLTLTTRPLTDESPKQCHDRVRPDISRLYQFARDYAGHFEAATFLELHRSGYPHWHALCRTGFIPQHKLSTQWNDLTGFPIVDIRRIRNETTAAKYVTKYITKSIQRQVHRRLGRLVTWTRHYLLREETNPHPATTPWQYFNSHPALFLETLPKHLYVTEDAPKIHVTVPSWDKTDYWFMHTKHPPTDKNPMPKEQEKSD